MNPKVSFIIPVYNAETYITQAVESVQKQTARDWELIIVDDGSTDSSLSIAKNLASKDNRIKVIEMSSPSGSAFLPRKVAVEQSQASLIAPLDADDFIEDKYLEKLLDLMETMEADMVFPSMYFYKEGDISYYLPEKEFITRQTFVGKDCVKSTLQGWRIGTNGGIIKRELYLSTLKEFDFPTHYANADELFDRYLLFNSGKVAFSEAKYFYRVVQESITRKPSLKQFDILYVNIALIKFTEEKFSKDSEEFRKAQLQAMESVPGALRKMNSLNFSSKDRKEILKRIEEIKKSVDYDFVREHAGKKIYFLSIIPLSLSKPLLKGYDIIKNRVNKLGFYPKTFLKKNLKYFDELRQLYFLWKGTYSAKDPFYDFYKKNYINKNSSKELSVNDIKEGVICLCNGKIYHGGLTDRLRGILSVYRETKKKGYPFFISWTSPFNLEEYLEPCEIDWRIKPEKIIYDSKYAFPFIDDDKTNFYSSLRLKIGLKKFKPQIHVYSNSDVGIGEYNTLYHELFKPTKLLQDNLKVHQEALGSYYDAFTFRFIGLLGDFQDWDKTLLNDSQQKKLMGKCYLELEKYMSRSDSAPKILVTGDSKIFLDYVKGKNDRIYIVEGDIKHIDLTKGDYSDAWLKTFIDQHLIMGAKRVVRMRTGGMYKSGFPRFAAEVGGAEFIDHAF